MKQLAYALLCIVLLGIIFEYGPGLLQQWGESGRRQIEEQAGIPVRASWREATGPGKVLILDYLNKEHGMTVTLEIKRPSTGEAKIINLDLDSTVHKQVEVGWIEGWSFQLGDTIHITSGNYAPRNVELK